MFDDPFVVWLLPSGSEELPPVELDELLWFAGVDSVWFVELSTSVKFVWLAAPVSLL